jgi:hypothetical protein
MAKDVRRVRRKRLPGVANTFVKATLLAGDHAEIIMRVGMAGLDVQDLRVQGARFGKLPASMTRQSFL